MVVTLLIEWGKQRFKALFQEGMLGIIIDKSVFPSYQNIKNK